MTDPSDPGEPPLAPRGRQGPAHAGAPPPTASTSAPSAGAYCAAARALEGAAASAVLADAAASAVDGAAARAVVIVGGGEGGGEGSARGGSAGRAEPYVAGGGTMRAPASALAGAPPVAWHRVRDFQLVALAHVAERLVAASGGAGAADSEGKQVRLAVKGGLAWASLSFARPVDVYTSPHEPRGAAVLAQLRERHEDAVRSTQRLDEGVPWLLCLSAHCFEGDVGALLVEEVRERGGRGAPCAHPLATHPLPPFPRPHHR